MNPPLQETENIRPAFTSLAEIKSALKLMVPPVTEEHRTAFITNLSESPHSRQLAFRLLALLVLKQAGRLDKILSLLERELTGLLAGGMEHLPARLPDGSSEDVMLWVGKQFPSPATRQEAVEYLETEQHLWTLFQILRWSGDTTKFMAALACYTDELEALTMAGSGGQKRRQTKKASGFSCVVTTLIKRVPTRPMALDAFLENLRLCRAFVAASAELQVRLEASGSRNERLRVELDGERASLVAEKAARETVEARANTALAELEAARSEIERLKDALRIQAGAYQVERIGASAEVLTAVRRRLLPDLENIRLYADRTEPNAAAVVRKAQELTLFLTEFQGS